MKDQWDLQSLILPRYRSLGIVGQLPGFQGNVPVALKDIAKDSNMTSNRKGTAWIDALDQSSCVFGDALNETYVAGCSVRCKAFQTLDEAKLACIEEVTCFGVTLTTHEGSKA